MKHRKLKDIDTEQLGTLLKGMLEAVDRTHSAEQLANDFHTIAGSLLEVFAPQKITLQTICPRRQWHNEEIKHLKHLKRKMERIWKDYPTAANWSSFKQAHSAHKNVIRREKHKVITARVIQHQGNPQELYNLTRTLTGTIPENPMPEALSNISLAEDFSDFFHDKVARICGALQGYETFTPPLANESVPTFDRFQLIDAEIIDKVIKSLPPKSCELDALPAGIFRKCIPY